MGREKRPFQKDWRRRENRELPPEKLQESLRRIYPKKEADQLFDKLMERKDAEKWMQQ